MGRTRLGLLAGAARAFAEHGLRRSTMQSIAAAAGVAKATLYNHFRTKDEVARALLAREVDRLTGLAADLPADRALAALSDELGAHPVLRRLAATEPEVLTSLLTVGSECWAELTGPLAAALRSDDARAELAGRWLVRAGPQPAPSTTRPRPAAPLPAPLAAPEPAPCPAASPQRRGARVQQAVGAGAGVAGRGGRVRADPGPERSGARVPGHGDRLH